MFVLGNFIIACGQILHWLITIMWFLLLVRALISWVSPDPFNPIVQFLYRVTEPVLAFIRRFLPFSMMSFSVIVAMLLLWFLDMFLVRSLIELGYRLK